MGNSIPNGRVYFRKNNVVVKFPGQAQTLEVIRLDLPPEDQMPSVRDGFEPDRLVINLKLADTTQLYAKMLIFDPPIEVRVRYDDVDLAKSASDPPKLAYWDGTQWIRFTVADHQLHKENWNAVKKRGWIVVNIHEWGDPTIGMGR